MLRSLHRLIAEKSPTVQRDVVALPLADGRVLDIQRIRDPRAKRIKLSVDERGARLTLPLRASPVSYTHLDVYKRQHQPTAIKRCGR